ncbi:MAG TPA: hypothetical protein VGJ60_07330 [Chloroflexota bacterium]
MTTIQTRQPDPSFEFSESESVRWMHLQLVTRRLETLDAIAAQFNAEGRFPGLAVIGRLRARQQRLALVQLHNIDRTPVEGYIAEDAR